MNLYSLKCQEKDHNSNAGFTWHFSVFAQSRTDLQVKFVLQSAHNKSAVANDLYTKCCSLIIVVQFLMPTIYIQFYCLVSVKYESLHINRG